MSSYNSLSILVIFFGIFPSLNFNLADQNIFHKDILS